jgi:hypothetical protein
MSLNVEGLTPTTVLAVTARAEIDEQRDLVRRTPANVGFVQTVAA